MVLMMEDILMKAGYHTDVWTRCAGAGHGTDVPFIFNTPDATTTPLDWDETAQTLGTRMQDVFINFARTGDPNIDGLPQWPKHTPDDLLFMIFDTQCRVSNDSVGAARRKAWSAAVSDATFY